MKNKRYAILKNKRLPAAITCCMMACLLFQGSQVTCQVKTLTVICNSNGTPDAMKFTELRSVLKGEKQRWNSGAAVSIALMKTSTPVGKNTAFIIFNMSGDALLKYWLGLTYQGNTHAPKFFNTISELQEYVAQNPGAIGVIDEPLASNEIKVIPIDGKTHFNL